MQAKFRSLFVMLSLVAGVHAGLSQPMLRIASAGGQSVLIWPTNAANYGLQSTTNLVSHNWQPFSNAVPVTVNTNFTVTVTNTSKAMFFRLYQETSAVPVTTGMVLIPAGTFTIGDTLDGESDAIPTNVTVSAFLMDSNLVSSSQWQSVYNWAINHGYNFVNAGSGKMDDHPVQMVDWYDCVKWCNARSQQAGLAPVYYTDAGLTQLYTNGEPANVFADWTAKGCRLPTEAEWEKAARGGLSGHRFPWGDTIDWSQANYFSYWPGGTKNFAYDLAPTNGYSPAFNDDVLPYTSPVGSFATNSYGLYDMAGNVEEWCWDWYDNDVGASGNPYAGGTDPHGPAASPFGLRVLRGGDWSDSADLARTARRITHSPFLNLNNFGLRCVKVP